MCRKQTEPLFDPFECNFKTNNQRNLEEEDEMADRMRDGHGDQGGSSRHKTACKYKDYDVDIKTLTP